MTKFLLLIVLCLGVNAYAFTNLNDLCENDKPLSFVHGPYTLNIICGYKDQDVTMFTFKTANSIHNFKVPGLLFVGGAYKITWPKDDLMQLYLGLSPQNNFTIFFDVKNWRVSESIPNLFALNVAKEIIAYPLDSESAVAVSPIFDLSKKILIKEDFTYGLPTIAVYPDETCFDHEGNFILDYGAGQDYTETKKVFSIDYSKLQ